MPSMSASATVQENLVSSREGDHAQLLDPNFINAWGIALRPAGLGGHWWIANTDASRVTLYKGDSPTVPFDQDGLSVLGVPGAPEGDPITIAIDPPSRDGVPLPPPNPTPETHLHPASPTGQVFSGSDTDFLVSGTRLTGGAITDAPARFITVSEDGTIAAWGEKGSTPDQRMNAFVVVVDNSQTGAVYKGVTVSSDGGSGNTLYAANFSQGRIDVFDAKWQPVATNGFVPKAPGGRDASEFSPFNVERVFDPSLGKDVLIVVCAKLANAAEGEEQSTDGFIAKYTLNGDFIASSDGGGLFNAPWGVAIAPNDYGAYGGDLLVGNFGDGKIVALDVATLEPEGYLLDGQGAPVHVDGLWDLTFGNGESLGRADRLYFSAGPEDESQGLFGSLSVGAGADDRFVFVGTAQADVKSGGGANDRLNGMGGDDTLLGQRGDDVLHGGRGNDQLFGGLGRDALFGGAGSDILRGQDGDDVLDGGDGRDKLIGGDGADTLLGQTGDDVLDGGAGRDRLYGGDGRDFLHGGLGDDLLYGGLGRDKLIGSDGADILLGQGGDDVLSGGAGRDRLFGGDGGDFLHGGLGDDVLSGGRGRDTLVGSAGADTFVFASTSDSAPGTAGRDVIQDFHHAQHDRIDLRGIDANTKAQGNQAFHVIGDHAFGHHAGELRAVVTRAGETIVSGDVNGDGKADLSIVLEGHLTLHKGDFLL